MEKIKNSRAVSLAIITLVYIVATVAGILIYLALPFDIWLKLLLADVASTIIVFIFSLIFDNASVYDPYWSVQPIVILTAFALMRQMNAARWLLLIAVWIWGIRLTGNWIYNFHSMNYQDWRYVMLKEKTGILYPVVNFLGIHMFPTLVVYACVLPAVYAFNMENTFRFGSVFFFVMSVAAAFLQFTADRQMHNFRRKGTHELINAGLWKYARHPNYLGEILMWWGISLASISAVGWHWWMIIGAAVNTLMFVFISVPMADKRQSEKEGFEEYMQRTWIFLPLPKNSNKH